MPELERAKLPGDHTKRKIFRSLSSERIRDDGISYWDGDGVVGRPSIKISVEDQRACFYKGNQIVGVSAVSTGREGYDTHPGKFRVMDKDIDHTSSLYGDYVDQDGHVVVQNVEAASWRFQGHSKNFKLQGVVRCAIKRSAICRSITLNERLAGSYAHILPDATSNHHPLNRRVPADTLSRTIA